MKGLCDAFRKEVNYNFNHGLDLCVTLPFTVPENRNQVRILMLFQYNWLAGS